MIPCNPRGAPKLIATTLILVAFLVLMAGCSSSSLPPLPSPPPSTQPPLKIAVLVPMTGELATFGEMVRNGVSLAFDEWNKLGDVEGHSIQWAPYDTQCDPDVARQAAERAITDGAQFFVGGLCSESAIPIARVAEEHGVLFVAVAATHPYVTLDLTGATQNLVFRAAYVFPYQGRAAARFAQQALGARRAAILVNPGDQFVRSAASEFRDTFVAGGGEIVAELEYTSQQSDFEALVANLATSGASVLYLPDAYPVANRVGGEMKAQGVEIVPIGSDRWENRSLDWDALTNAYFTAHYSRAIPTTTAEDWAGRYRSAYALEPDTLSALGYDAASLLLSAVSLAQSVSPPVVAHTMATAEFQTITGPLRFDEQHNPLKKVVVMEIVEDQTRFVTTVPISD